MFICVPLSANIIEYLLSYSSNELARKAYTVLPHEELTDEGADNDSNNTMKIKTQKHVTSNNLIQENYSTVRTKYSFL